MIRYLLVGFMTHSTSCCSLFDPVAHVSRLICVHGHCGTFTGVLQPGWGVLRVSCEREADGV